MEINEDHLSKFHIFVICLELVANQLDHECPIHVKCYTFWGTSPDQPRNLISCYNRTPLINVQYRLIHWSMSIKILALIPMPINSDQFLIDRIERYWEVLKGIERNWLPKRRSLLFNQIQQCAQKSIKKIDSGQISSTNQIHTFINHDSTR